MTTDYKDVAETLRGVAARVDICDYAGHLDAAIRLCELAAKLPGLEAERVLEAAVANRQDDDYRCELQAKRDRMRADEHADSPYDCGGPRKLGPR